MIIDTGCPKDVAGKAWLDAYVEDNPECIPLRTS
jgi:hypothetical protein